MTRRDFVLIATTIKQMPEAPAIRTRVAIEFAVALSTAFPSFDKDKFLKACGVPK